jgi:hypothetical protein
MSEDPRCWFCGVEPDDSYEIMTLESADPVRVIHRWPPATDHVHEEHKPTPEVLLDRGAAPVTIVEFLRRMLDEEERAARAAADQRAARWLGSDGGDVGAVTPLPGGAVTVDSVGSVKTAAESEHIARHDPARVLADVEAKRKILDWLDRMDNWATDNNLWTWDSAPAHEALALPYADHPDYDESWRL